MKKFVFFIGFFLFSAVCFAQKQYQTQIDNAQKNFKSGNFIKTIEIYESLIQIENVNNPYIYYNLANAYYRNGNIGKAVLNIEKAAKLAPRDKDIKNNFEIIFNASGQKNHKETLSGFLTQFFSLNELAVIFAVFIISFFVLASIYIFKKTGFLKISVRTLIVALILYSPFFILAAYDEIAVDYVVLLSQYEAKSGPSENEPSIFELQEGKIANVISVNSDWSYIKTKNNGKILEGWVENSILGKISV
jgi:tetratricopeptide (TPR) repeat protein